MMDLLGRHGKPETEKLFDELVEITDEEYIRTLNPLNPTYEPALTFNLQGAVYHSGFNRLNKDSQDQIKKLARSFIEKYNPLRLVAICVSLNKFPHVSYSTQTLQETFTQSNFKIIDHHYLDAKGHITGDATHGKTIACTLEKLSRVCASCNKVPVVSQRCSRCKNTHYCNADCQKADWQSHKQVCKQL